MQIKIGDKIRFLNDIGGGVVIGFNGTDYVVVEQESGFSFPHPLNECVLISEGVASSSVSTSGGSASQPVVAAPIDKSPDRYNVSLAFAPQDITNIDSSSMRAYLINDSEYRLFFTLSSRDDEKGDNYKMIKNGAVKPNEILLIDTFTRANIAKLENLLVQVIAYRDYGSAIVPKPIDKKVTTRLVRFSKRGSYNHSQSLGCDAIITDLTSANVTQTIADQFDIRDKKPAINTQIRDRRDVATTPEVVEVDLHIDKLLDSTAGMSSGDMLEYQMDHFRSVMAQYSRYRGLKLIFIHGKGDGVLRRSLLQELKRMGRADRCQEASFKRYGYGALMVIM